MGTFDAKFRAQARALLSPSTYNTIDKKAPVIIKLVLLLLAAIGLAIFATYQVVLVVEALNWPVWRRSVEFNETLQWPGVMMCPGTRMGHAFDKYEVLNCTSSRNGKKNSECYWRKFEDPTGQFTCLNFNFNGTSVATGDANACRLTVYLKGESLLPNLEWTQIMLYDANKGWTRDTPPLFYLSTIDRSSSLIVITKAKTVFRNGTEIADFSAIPSTIYHPLTEGFDVSFAYRSLYVDVNKEAVSYEWPSALGQIGGAFSAAKLSAIFCAWLLTRIYLRCSKRPATKEEMDRLLDPKLARRSSVASESATAGSFT